MHCKSSSYGWRCSPPCSPPCPAAACGALRAAPPCPAVHCAPLLWLARAGAGPRREPGRDQPSFDKQIRGSILLTSGWDRNPPHLNCLPTLFQRTSEAYQDCLLRLTDKELEL